MDNKAMDLTLHEASWLTLDLSQWRNVVYSIVAKALSLTEDNVTSMLQA